jgi:hypothetical protein
MDLEETGSGFSKRFEGYSDYEIVSLRLGESIDKAVDAYAQIDAAHSEDANISPQFAAKARGRILSAAIKLLPALYADRDSVDTYDEMLEEWEEGVGGEPGYIDRLKNTSLRRECPDWLYSFVLDIRRAGWELGHLQAGRTTKEYDDPVEGETEAMFEGLNS